MTHLSQEQRKELLEEWKLLYPTGNELVAVPGQINPAIQSPHRAPILKGEGYAGISSYCYDFDSLRIELNHHRGHQIMARTCSMAGSRGSRVDFGINHTRHNETEIEKLYRVLSQNSTRTTIGYSVGGRVGSIRLLRYVAVPSLSQGLRTREFIFE